MTQTQRKVVDGILVASVALTFAATISGICHADRVEHSKAAEKSEALLSMNSKPAIVETVKTSPITVKATPIKEEESKVEFMAFDVPLEDELQLHILNECEKYGIDPAIITAMAFKESRYQASAIGDNGNSIGLMQIQPRWNAERMEKLGCSDLLDPYENVTVAVDILAELIEHYNGNIEKAVTAYNMGMTGAYNNCFSKGVYASEYCTAVMEKAEELRAGAFGVVIE